jgi:hypothetical protein
VQCLRCRSIPEAVPTDPTGSGQASSTVKRGQLHCAEQEGALLYPGSGRGRASSPPSAETRQRSRSGLERLGQNGPSAGSSPRFEQNGTSRACPPPQAPAHQRRCSVHDASKCAHTRVALEQMPMMMTALREGATSFVWPRTQSGAVNYVALPRVKKESTRSGREGSTWRGPILTTDLTESAWTGHPGRAADSRLPGAGQRR